MSRNHALGRDGLSCSNRRHEPSRKPPVTSAKTQKLRQTWRADWFVGLVVVVLLLLVHQATDLMGGMERRFYDWAATSTGVARAPSDRIAVIAIDDASIANYGRWPWPRDVQARLIDVLVAAKAKVVAHTVFFFEPQADGGLSYIRQLRDALGKPEYAAIPETDALLQQLTQAEQKLDGDAALGGSMERSGSVLLPAVFVLGEPQGRPDHELPDYVGRTALDDTAGAAWPTVRGLFPLPLFGKVASGVGHLNQINDVDGALRAEPLFVNYFGKAVPSLALLTAMKSLNLEAKDLRFDAAAGQVQVGKLRIGTDDHGLMLPRFYQSKDGKPAFQVDSFFDVLTGKIPASKYTDKIVIIGATAAGVGVQFPVPGYAALTPVETAAHIVSSILREHYVVQPAWAPFVAMAAFVLIALYLMLLLPRLSAAIGASATVVLLLALLGAEYGLLGVGSQWVKLVFPAALLLFGHLALTTKRFLVTEAGKIRSDEESAETNRMMGLAYQGQGQLDMAFDRFRRVPLSDAVMDNLNSLALDFERKRQFNKAQTVYEHMATWNKDYKDLQSRMKRVKGLSETVILGGGSGVGGTLLLDDGAVEKPMLGRYQIDKELGKGAMGVVYQGKDPKIGRVVAIKTMALGQEFEGDALDDARERFFREAETAGRLQHPNIVTIFDAGEEHDLAYIAMEFLRGRDLVEHCRDGNLLPVPTVLSIIARIAEALDYAHRQNVVHRDVKPANIMYEASSDTVKVTDFGIARITDSSKTKTGLVLGTPSFMSPEQIAGKKVDGRSDLYSLGVMLYQMLTGVLPFRGDSMAELMYKIANEAAPDIRLVRKDLSPGVATVVALSLNKRLELRYQTGAQFAADLRAIGVESSPHMVPASATVPQPASAASAAEFEKTVAAAERTSGVPTGTAVPGSDKTVPYVRGNEPQ